MLLEHGALKILYVIHLPVQVALFLEFLGNREALLGQAPLIGPVEQELPPDGMLGLWEIAGTLLGLARPSYHGAATYARNGDQYASPITDLHRFILLSAAWDGHPHFGLHLKRCY